MNPKNPSGRKVVKAWAVLCPDNGYVWAFEHKDAANEAKQTEDAMGHGKHKVVPCTVTYKSK